MNESSLISKLEGMVLELISADPALFLVDIRIKPTNNIKVFIDGDEGISIERLVQFNRKMYRQLEETMFPSGDFSLELSSPGLDEPLKLHRQYLKNVGRHVEVTAADGSKKEGKMLSVSESALVLEEEKGKTLNGRPTGKKKEIVQHTIPFDEIKSTKVQIKF